MLLPIAIETRSQEPFVVLIRATAAQFREPFFVDTLQHQLGIRAILQDRLSLVRPLIYDFDDSRLVRTPLADFVRAYDHSAPRKLGFIFHITRCGSTLVAQMLAENQHFFVLSEPTILDAILDPLGPIRSGYDRVALLRATVNCLADFAPQGRTMAIKCRSWNTLHATVVQAAAPTALCLFLHRSGVEVLISVLRNPPGWMRARDTYAATFQPFLQLSTKEILALPDDEYAARMIGAFCRVPGTLPVMSRMIVDYNDVIDQIGAIAAHFGVITSVRELSLMHDRARFYSKDSSRSQVFASDVEDKRRRATSQLHLLAEQFIESHRHAIVL